MEGPASRKAKSERKSVAGLEVRLRFGVHPRSHGEHVVIGSIPSPFAEWVTVHEILAGKEGNFLRNTNLASGIQDGLEEVGSRAKKSAWEGRKAIYREEVGKPWVQKVAEESEGITWGTSGSFQTHWTAWGELGDRRQKLPRNQVLHWGNQQNVWCVPHLDVYSPVIHDI